MKCEPFDISFSHFINQLDLAMMMYEKNSEYRIRIKYVAIYTTLHSSFASLGKLFKVSFLIFDVFPHM